MRVDQLLTDALLLGQRRDLCDLCQRQDGKTLALVGWHVGCYALWVIHRVLTSRQKAQVSTMGRRPLQTALQLLVGGLDSTEKCDPVLNHTKESLPPKGKHVL